MGPRKIIFKSAQATKGGSNGVGASKQMHLQSHVGARGLLVRGFEEKGRGRGPYAHLVRKDVHTMTFIGNDEKARFKSNASKRADTGDRLLEGDLRVCQGR